MTTQQYVLCAAVGLLGMLFHLFVIKIPSAMTRAKAANIQFTVSNFISTEWVGIGSSILAIAIALVVLPELLKYKPEINSWLKILFAFYGFTGSSILLALFGKVSAQINKVVDIKTDMSDDKISKDEGAEKLESTINIK